MLSVISDGIVPETQRRGYGNPAAGSLFAGMMFPDAALG